MNNNKNYRIDGNWVIDCNGNYASSLWWGSEAKAIESLETLKNCVRCVNCTDCENCTNCKHCTYCADCELCEECYRCRFQFGMTSVSFKRS